ncbi:MAG: excinuclease ABC subunit UvrA [candidate division KSB1 bacterium]|nr:excinuclease ABC subunit UvrA [candidate division KSB1 bacterium]MDZ7303968.1 excinuclease ABC subunit UvrA [candidate division KSB1 bacterium]MDZ7313686.1 excinuclease ABC subunit UvrA [candidate division KSB1 bacterium]
MPNVISIRGARVHNLKNLDLDLPRNRLIVITGVSGSGKSSLAFDTLYAEGQRRYVESLSAYARQFLERMDRPDVDEIKGISPAVAIEQKNPVKSSRSTVATATEIHDYLRLLFARIGHTFCPQCGREVKKDQVEDVLHSLRRIPPAGTILVTFPLRREAERVLEMELVDCRRRGFYRLFLDEKIVQLDELKPVDLKRRDEVLVVVDRIDPTGSDFENRLAEAVDQAFANGQGRAAIILAEHDNALSRRLDFSQAFECATCRTQFIEPQPRLFSFNNPFGACPTCRGFGDVIEIDLDLVVPDKSKSLREGAIVPWTMPSYSEMNDWMLQVARRYRISTTKPFRELDERELKIILDGEPEGEFPGIRGFFQWLESKRYKIGIRVFLSRYRGYVRCPDCNGSRLRKEALHVRIGHSQEDEKTIADICRMTIAEAHRYFLDLQLTPFEESIARQILKELRNRLGYLVDAGLGYLTLDRRTQTLSGGEAQRINLATILGSQLVGSLYILDEPTIGLHPRDNQRLIRILKMLQEIGNTVVVVEHDREMMETSDFIVDLGPRAGRLGGEIVFRGPFNELIKNGKASLTGAYLKGEKSIQIPSLRRSWKDCLEIRGAREHNLKNLNVKIPLHVFVTVTGVSGSGKSTLVHDVLYSGLMRAFGRWPKRVGDHDEILGIEHIDDAILVDQSPIGRTPRSNPATYIKAFDDIRQLFAKTMTAKLKGYWPSTFSFNTDEGRCPICEGAGAVKVEMQFLADIFLQCEACEGKRFKKEVLEVTYRGKNIVDVLNMTVDEAVEFFGTMAERDKLAAKATQKLQLLKDVGLGYMQLGQPATTLSGGEAQRVKLAAHLAQKEGQHILYIFDEPTTGLHFDDVSKLLQCFDRLIAAGNSVLVIEHNMEVIKCADWIIDLGPEGGDAGGYVIAQGTPEQVAQDEKSWTGRFLKMITQ